MTLPIGALSPLLAGKSMSPASLEALPQAFSIRPDLVSGAASASGGPGGIPLASAGIGVKNAEHTPAEMQKVAKQFEAIFLRMMLKEMRSTVEKSGLSANSPAMKLFESMQDDQTADSLSNQGIGIGNLVYQQLAAKLQHLQKTAPAP